MNCFKVIGDNTKFINALHCNAVLLCTPRIHKIPFEKFMHGLGKKVIENFIAEQNVGRCVESE